MKNNIFVYLILFASVLIFFNACRKKNEDVKVSGKIINPGNNQSIAGAKVSLSSTSVQSWVYNSNFQDIETMESLADGTFKFVFKEQVASAYRIHIFKSNYFVNTTIINANDISQNNNYDTLFHLYPEAQVVLNVKNAYPQDTNDRILYKILLETSVCSGCCPQGYIQGLGANYDTIVSCKSYGNMYFVVESNITKGITTNIRKDSIYLLPFEQNTLNIYY